jgi:DNA repair protein RecN (Recombination protein N)
MLLELHIAGLGVIEDVTLELPPGLSVLTGETGAGKTMITVGLSLVLGQRARSGMIRARAPRATAEAKFDASSVPRAKEWAEDLEVVLARTISADGRSSARAGGQIAPVSTLSEIGAELVEVHGQHQTQRLLTPPAQTGFLDRYAGPLHLGTLGSYRGTHGAFREARARLERLDAGEREREREKDLLAYQVREIEAARLRPGEAQDLEEEASRLAHAERIRDRLTAALSALAEEGGGADALHAAAAALADAAEVDPGAAGLAERLRSLAADAEDVGQEVRARAEAVDLDPTRLEEVRQRIAAIKGLERKYGEGEAEVLAFLERCRRRMADLERDGREREELGTDLERLSFEVDEAADQLAEARRDAAPRLAGALEGELRELGMEGASMEVRLQPLTEPGPDGAESVTLMFSGGPDQSSQPLARVASGGELSRLMLACRTVMADLDAVPTLVFDEVDAGIGGRAGVAVGRRLARLAMQRQVLVVTHLPQIACFADRHFRVTKERGVARVAPLEGEERVEELSRMLSGMPTDESATHAEQLLAEAAREKE